MVGREIGALVVRVADLCAAKQYRGPHLLWQKTGEQEDKWLFAEVPILNVTSR